MTPILVLNAGSSSLKFSLFDGEQETLRGLVERIGLQGVVPHAVLRDGSGATLLDGPAGGPTHHAVLDWLLGWLPGHAGGVQPAAVGHRVVHGGDFTAPARVTADVLARLEALIPLAPLHQAHNLEPMRYFLDRRPELPQVACFDTAFHAGQERIERLFGLPRSYFDRGIKRYGFHGLSYEYIAGRLAEIDPRAASGKTVVCHLGNGASLCALRGGRSAASTMGFTPLDGLVMGTRCGTLDPGVLLFLADHDRLDPEQVTDLLWHQSGLLGVSGQSADMRDLLGSERPEAVEAVALFCYRIARELGALTAVLGGLDCLVFTAGIGEHAASVRAQVCHRAAWLGVELDPVANAARRAVISTPASKVTVRVIPTNEEVMIVRHTVQALASPA